MLKNTISASMANSPAERCKEDKRMKQENIIIRRETQIDHAAVERLTREAFWNVYRPGCLEH